MHHSVLQKNTPEIKGMINRISHLVEVEAWDGEEE
jgi:ribosomal protein L30/L7E